MLHPLGKRQPHVRSVLSFGFVFPTCYGLCSWLCRLQTEGLWRDSSLPFLLLLFCGDEIASFGRIIYLCDGGPDFQLYLGHFVALWLCNGSLESSQITFAPPLKHFCSDRMVLDDCWVHGHWICNGLINWQLYNYLLKITWTLRCHR